MAGPSPTASPPSPMRRATSISRSPSGMELFTLQPTELRRAGRRPLDADLVGWRYVLTEINGTVERFLPDGQISSITDSNGNTIDVSYNASGVISGVTSSNGQSLTFTTNAEGRITSATDDDGQTTTYTYDASGDHPAQRQRPQRRDELHLRFERQPVRSKRADPDHQSRRHHREFPIRQPGRPVFAIGQRRRRPNHIRLPGVPAR